MCKALSVVQAVYAVAVCENASMGSGPSCVLLPVLGTAGCLQCRPMGAN